MRDVQLMTLIGGPVRTAPMAWSSVSFSGETPAYMLARLAVSRHRRGAMAEFMDVHRGMVGITPEGLLEAHQADLAIQGEENVDFKHAWADPKSGMVFCLSEAPSAEAVQRIHERAGHPADEVYEVPVQA
jgi:Protein of unknown function (DUF4242)